MTEIKQISKNISSLFISNIVTYFLSFFSVVYLARVLGPEAYGYVEYAIAITSYFLILANAGLPIIGIKRIAEQKGLNNSGFSDILCIRGVLGIISCLSLVIFIFGFSPYSSLQNSLILGYAVAIIPMTMNIDWIFKGIQKMHLIIIGTLCLSGLNFFFIIFFIKNLNDLNLLPIFIVISNTVSTLVSWYILMNTCENISFFINISTWKSIFKKSIQFGSISIMSLFIYNSDLLFLGVFKTSYEVGLYAASYKFVYLIIGLSTPIHESLFPVLVNAYHENYRNFKKIGLFIIRFSVFFSLSLMSGIIFLNSNFLSFVFGTKFVSAHISLLILIWACGLILINTALSRILFVTNHENICMRIIGFQCIIVLVLNILLIPIFGLIGASVVTFLGEFFSLIIFSHEINKIINLRWNELKISFAIWLSIIIGIISYFLRDLYLPILLIILGLLFALLIFLFGGITKEELTVFRRGVLKGKSET